MKLNSCNRGLTTPALRSHVLHPVVNSEHEAFGSTIDPDFEVIQVDVHSLALCLETIHHSTLGVKLHAAPGVLPVGHCTGLLAGGYAHLVDDDGLDVAL